MGDRPLPAPPRAALRIPAAEPLATSRATSTWATVARPVAARSVPAAGASVVGRLGVRTPEGTTGVVPVLARARGAGGRLWVRVAVPALPNGTRGWVPRRALGGLTSTRTRLVVDLSALRATLLRDGRAVFRAPVGIGAAGTPTPTGSFLVRNRLTRYRSAFYGPVAFGTSARSATLDDWPAGGFVGIHGTDRPELLPGRVSHGCLRLRNRDVLRLARLMPVGTPLTVRA